MQSKSHVSFKQAPLGIRLLP